MSQYYSALKSQFTPSSLSPVLFVNPYQDSYVNTVDNNGTRQRGNILDSATATTGQALAVAGTLASKPIYNGEGWYFSDGAQLTTGAVSTYNFLHTGSDFDIWCTVFICPTASTTYSRAILCNNGFSNTAKGILLRLNSSVGSNQLEFRCGNGTSAFISMNASGALTVNATNIIRVRRSGSNATMFVNGTQVATQTISLSPGTGDAAAVMNICQNTSSTAQVYLKDVVLFNRVLTASEATSMNARTFARITPTAMNVYLMAGDSNCAGLGVNSAIASDLIGNISGAYAEALTSTLDYSSWAGILLLGTNQNIPSQNPATAHGSEMRFGKSMGAVADSFIIKYGVGSNTVFQRNDGGGADFNINTLNSSYRKWIDSVLPVTLNDIVHSYRRTPVFRGFLWIEGTNDAIYANQSVSWVRVGTTATITSTNHQLISTSKLAFYNSSDATTIPLGLYQVTVVNANTFTITVPNTGALSGTLDYSGAYYFKENVTAVVNGTIDYLQNTIKNQITNGTGYTVDKLRLVFIETKAGASSANATGYAQVLAGQQALGANYLTDNPSRSVNVKGSTSIPTNDIPTTDTVHFTTAGYDTYGQRQATYLIPFVNE